MSEEQKPKTRKKRGRKPHATTNEVENRLAIMQNSFDQLNDMGIDFRDKVLYYCGWSPPTYYRKKKNGNFDKQDALTINMAFASVLKQVFTLVNDMAKLMPPADIIMWSQTSKRMGFDEKGKFRSIPEKLGAVIGPDNQEGK